MKKNRIDFQSRLGMGSKKHCGVRLMKAFFESNDLAGSKERLNSIMNYAVKRNIWIQEDPSAIFLFRQSMQSFVRAGYLMALKKKKMTNHTQLENASPLLLGLLSEKEYRNPLLVFKKAFQEYSIEEFDYFMSGIIYFSLGAYDHVPERNMVSPFIHLTKMLDAAQLILERRGNRDNNEE